MENSLLFEYLDGLFAYDTGCTDSGTRDSKIRYEVKEYIKKLSNDDFRIVISKFIREYFLSDEALEQGYGIADVDTFLRWLDEFYYER